MSRGWLYLRTGLNHLTPLRLPHLNLRNVLILALLVRLLFLFAVVLPFFEKGVLNKADTREFDQEAQAIAFQGQNSLDYPEWGILYYMAGIYRLFGPCPLAVGLTQIGVAVLVCLGIYLIGKLISGPQVGLWAALGFALYPEAIYWAAFPMKDCLLALEIVIVVCCGVCLSRKRSFWVLVPMILASGALYVTRPPYIGLAVLVLGLALIFRLRSWVLRLILVTFGLLLGIAIWRFVPAVQQAIHASLPPSIWDHVLQNTVPIGTLFQHWYNPGYLLPRVGLAFKDVWALMPRKGYGYWGVLLAPFALFMLLTAAHGLIKSLWQLKRNPHWLLVVLPLLCYTALMGITVRGLRFRYPLVPLMWVLSGFSLQQLFGEGDLKTWFSKTSARLSGWIKQERQRNASRMLLRDVFLYPTSHLTNRSPTMFS